MIIYFADRRMNILGQASIELPQGPSITEDLKTEEITEGAAVFECCLPFTDDTRGDAEKWAEAGNYLLRKNGEEAEYYTIIESEVDTKSQEIYIYAEDAGLDLLNEVVGAYEADRAYPAVHYIEKFTYDSGFEIGLNEISDLSRKLKWEGEQTATARILSVATQFDAEISFSFEVENLSITHKYINLYKARGKDSGVELRLNRDIDRIITKKSVANLATALIVTGGTPEGQEQPITLSGYQYDDGDFHVDGTMLKSRAALQKWSRYLSETGTDVGHIVQTYSYDTTSKSELCNRAVSALKKICDMEVNYEVDIAVLPQGVKIGDTVNIVDDSDKLYLSARILKLETSVADKKAKATLGDYMIKGSGISQKLEELASQFQEIAKNRALYTWVAYADDAQGTGISADPTGKRYMGTSANKITQTPDLSMPSAYTWVLIKGEDGADGKNGADGEPGAPGPKGEDGKTYYTWLKYADTPTSGMSDSPSGKAYIGLAYNKETPDGSTSYSDYTWSLIKGEKGDTGIPGGKGADGKTYYTWIKYATSASGADMSDSPAGKTYIGLAHNKETATESANAADYTWSLIKGDKGDKGEDGVGISGITEFYAVSASNSTAPSAWVTTPPNMTATNKYLWNYEKITYTDGNSLDTKKRVIGVYGDKGATGAAGSMGAAGKGIKSVTNYYLATASSGGVTASTSGWTTTVQSVSSSKKYLWNYEVITYTDNSSTSTPPCIIGTYGDKGDKGDKGDTGATGPKGPTGAAGKGIKSTSISYQASASGTAVPTGTWTAAIPSVGANQYLWTRTVITYTDNTTSTSYSIGKMGATGPAGATGAPGTAGKGIKSTAVTYQAFASGTTVPTGAWSPSIPSVAANSYLWTRTVITYTDNTTSTSYSIGKMGATGATGAKGDSGIIVSTSAPASPKTGQLWQSAAGQPIKRWDGIKWVIHYISVENLSVEALSAITANLGIVTAGMIKNADGTTYLDVTNGVFVSYSDKFLESAELKNGMLRLDGKDEGTNRIDVLYTHTGISVTMNNKTKKLVYGLSGGEIDFFFDGIPIIKTLNELNSKSKAVETTEGYIQAYKKDTEVHISGLHVLNGKSGNITLPYTSKYRVFEPITGTTLDFSSSCAGIIEIKAGSNVGKITLHDSKSYAVIGITYIAS